MSGCMAWAAQSGAGRLRFRKNLSGNLAARRHSHIGSPGNRSSRHQCAVNYYHLLLQQYPCDGIAACSLLRRMS